MATYMTNSIMKKFAANKNEIFLPKNEFLQAKSHIILHENSEKQETYPFIFEQI